MKISNGPTQNGTTNPEMMMSLLIRPGKNEEEILIGLKLNGPMKGYVLPPGGKIENGETRSAGAFRETKDESHLQVTGGATVARLHRITLNPRMKKVVHLIRYRKWKGRLSHCRREFRWLRFVPFSKIPWEEFPPKDVDWMKKVILEDKKLKAVVTYRYRNRGWIRTRTYPLRG